MEADPRVDPGRVCARRSDDEVYAAANSLRQEAAGYRRAVEHSARQLVYNTWSLKVRKEVANGDGKELCAHPLADFRASEIRTSAGNKDMRQKRTFSTCMTICKRICSCLECEAIVVADESAHGLAVVWNRLSRFQEGVYRCGKPRKILWLMTAAMGWNQTEKFTAADITVAALQSGPKSISDIALQQMTMRDFLF